MQIGPKENERDCPQGACARGGEVQAEACGVSPCWMGVKVALQITRTQRKQASRSKVQSLAQHGLAINSHAVLSPTLWGKHRAEDKPLTLRNLRVVPSLHVIMSFSPFLSSPVLGCDVA